MPTFERVPYTPMICGIELDFGGTTIPSTILGYQPFNNSVPVDIEFIKAYFGRASVRFSEESVKTSAGTSYKQKVIFQFRATDNIRAERLEMFKFLKHVKVRLSNYTSFIIGRNDYFQNAMPDVKYSANEKVAAVEVATESIFSAGYIQDAAQLGLPAFIPVSLSNLN